MPYLRLNGLRFHYHLDDYTEPWQAKSVVLLHHAAAGNLHRWRAWVGIFSLPGLAADIAAVLDGLEIEKVHLVGASAGGIVSLRFAHDFPQRLHSLSLETRTETPILPKPSFS